MGKHQAHTTGRQNEKRYTRLCEWCGTNFASSRFDATTCSHAHRSAFSRWCRKVIARTGQEPMIGPRGTQPK